MHLQEELLKQPERKYKYRYACFLNSLFYLAKSGVHWLKKNAGNQSVLRNNEILLLKVHWVTALFVSNAKFRELRFFIKSVFFSDDSPGVY